MKIKFWGTRGSIPVPGKNTIKYGGNTPCIQITQSNSFIIIDAGSGIREAGKSIVEEKKFSEINIFISHTHWDHIQGLPFFAPLFEEGYRINIFTNKISPDTSNHILDHLLNPDFFPVNPKDLKAEVSFFYIDDRKSVFIDEFKVSASEVHHLNKALAFKISSKGKDVVYMPDNEIYSSSKNDKIIFEDILAKNEKLINFCSEADYLIHDCMYSFDDSIRKKGWGHSDNISLSYFAIHCKIKNLILFHYEPDYTDTEIDKMVEETTDVISHRNSEINVIPSRELLELSI